MKRTSWFFAVLTVVVMIVTHFAGSRDAKAQGTGPGFRGPAAVVIEQSGDLVVVDRFNDAVFRVMPNTGDRIIVSGSGTGTGPIFAEPVDVAIERLGTFVVVDKNLDAVVWIDPVTGDRTVISGCSQTPDPCPVPLIGTGPAFLDLASIAVETRGTLVVADLEAKAVIRVDPLTGNRTILSSADRGTGPELDEPGGIVVQANGSLALVDLALDAVVEVDAITGDRRIVSGCSEQPDPCPVALVGSGPSFVRPIDLSVRPSRVLTVVDIDLGAVIDVNPNNGNRTIVSSADRGLGPVFLNPLGIAIDRNRRLFVTEPGRRAVMQVAPTTGTRTIISQAPALTISPPEGTYTTSQAFDLVLIVEGDIDDVAILRATLNTTEDVTTALNRCMMEQPLTGSGIAIRCENADAVLGLDPGRYRFDIRIEAFLPGGGSIQLRGRTFWNILGEDEGDGITPTQDG
ncbi:hypothetical protein [Candidatus Entotheonella palauensis]|uniref:hypothetical protein n=1 Tax=Candidatus Entotheonella palauensis TaxID=93172 RepID=UPI000B7E9523|nr:hypothetical protein [Candidatus Entotheonella palauensis]